jgi:hypothetical protein
MDHFRIGGRRQVGAGTPSPALFDLPPFGPGPRCSSPKRGLSFCCATSDDSHPSGSQGCTICRSSFNRRWSFRSPSLSTVLYPPVVRPSSAVHASCLSPRASHTRPSSAWHHPSHRHHASCWRASSECCCVPSPLPVGRPVLPHPAVPSDVSPNLSLAPCVSRTNLAPHTSHALHLPHIPQTLFVSSSHLVYPTRAVCCTHNLSEDASNV